MTPEKPPQTPPPPSHKETTDQSDRKDMSERLEGELSAEVKDITPTIYEAPLDKQPKKTAINEAKLGLSTPSEIKQKFLEPFTDEEKREFVSTFKQAAGNPEANKLFEKNISENITFIAYKTEENFGGSIMFRIMEGEDIKAQITFNPEDGNVLNMVHREAQSQSLGISGSSLLRKIEEYFKVLQESKVLSPETNFSVEAGQATVAQWALKNGYRFKNTEQEQLFDSIISGKKLDEYIVTDIGDGKLFDSYIFKRDVYDQHERDIDNDSTLAKKYSIHFTLIKKSIH